LALLCRRFGATPNQITLFSLLSSLVAFAGLALNQINFFFLFWALSVIADFADGTLARLTSNFSKFRFDHYTDVFKIGIVLLGMGIYFENPEVWLSTSFAMFSFFVFTSLNDSKSVKLPPQQTYKGTKVRPETGNQSKSRLRDIRSVTLVTLFTFNGHSLLLFFLIPLNEIFAVAALLYIGVICSLHYLLLWRRILVDSGD
jgi:phosphatidylglycerophosphate synthase